MKAERPIVIESAARARNLARVTSPAPRDAWRELLKADPNALVSQSPEWADAMCELGGYSDASRLYEFPGGRSAVLPMARLTGLYGLFGVESSFPEAWGFGGLVAGGAFQPEDVAAVFADLRGRLAVRTSIRPDPLTAAVWEAGRLPGIVALPRTAHLLDLGPGFAAIRAGFSTEARRGLKKAESSGLEVECDTTGRLVSVFYGLFSQSVERWADKQHERHWLARWRAERRDPMRKFEVLSRRLGGAFRIWVARHNGRPAAAIIVLQGANAHYTRGAMDKEIAGPTRANYLLHSLAIEDACKAGSRYYHMGDTRAGSSLARFKEHFGARPCGYAVYRVERLPVTGVETLMRRVAKRIIGFKDA